MEHDPSTHQLAVEMAHIDGPAGHFPYQGKGLSSEIFGQALSVKIFADIFCFFCKSVIIKLFNLPAIIMDGGNRALQPPTGYGNGIC